MKKLLLPTILLASIINLPAQTVTVNNLPNAQTQAINYIDTGAKMDIIPSGTNQVYDFTNLKNNLVHTLEFGTNPRTSFLDNQFSSSNLKASSSWSTGSTRIQYYQSSSTSFIYKGTAFGSMSIAKSNDIWAMFPLSVGSSFSDTVTQERDNYAFSYDPDGSGPLPKLDSFYSKEITIVKLTGVSSGKLKLPNIETNVVWQKKETINDNTYRAYYNGMWQVPSKDLLDALVRTRGLSSSSEYNAWSYDMGNQSFMLWADEENGKLAQIEWNSLASSSLNSLELLNFSLYPNPTNKTLTITSNHNIDKICITDILGKVYEASINGSFLDVAHLKSGIYTITVTDVNGKTGHQKFVKL